MENSNYTEDETNMEDKIEEMGNDSQDNVIDTSNVFQNIFQGKTKFDSWEEFISPFEQFQMMTNSAFKPKSTERVDFVNEKKKGAEKIPEKFVYTAVSLICQHFGVGVRKKGSTRKPESYVGQDCEAFIKLSYKKGSLQIIKYNLVHTNHSLDKSAQMRNIRPVLFNDDLDVLVCKVAEESNVFETRIATANWENAVSHLSEADPKLEHLTRRMLKKRLHFLMERYAANSEGSEPLDHDEMGQILHRLLKQKKTLLTPSVKSRRGRKRKRDGIDRTPKRRGRGRPRKSYRELDGDDDDDDDDEDNSANLMDDDDDYPNGDDDDDNDGKKGVVSSSDIRSLLRYWKKRDANKQKMQWEKVQLRKEELEMQKKKFEFEQQERLALLEVLKTQNQLINSMKKAQQTDISQISQSQQQTKAISREYILNKDGTLRPVMSNPYEHKTMGMGMPVQGVSTPNPGMVHHYADVMPQ